MGIRDAQGALGGCLRWLGREWRVLGVRVEGAWDGNGECSGTGGCLRVAGAGMEGAQGEPGGCSEQEQRVLGMSEGCSG